MIKNLTDIPGVAAYLKRVDAEPRGMLSAVVRKREGKYWADKSIVKFDRQGMISVSHDEVKPTDTEQDAIIQGFAGVELPSYRTLGELSVDAEGCITQLNSRLAKANEEDRLFIFRNTQGEVLMLQERVEDEDGEKQYLPWTYWSDERWRLCESGDLMPLYGLEELSEYGVIWVHEGAKAARHCQRLRGDPSLLENHPWAKDLQDIGHVGWCSGAPTPLRTDWGPLRNAQKVYIVADNDGLGKDAIPKISRQLRGQVFYVQFTDEFPACFDMADEFPKSMFLEGNSGEVYYQGPNFHEVLHPATWATDKLEHDKKRSTHVLRPSFRDQWAWVKDADLFVCKSMPELICSDKILNRLVAPFSDVKNTSDLLSKSLRDRTFNMAYRPDKPELIITNRGTSSINVHVPSRIEELPGEDISPWLEFMEYLIPEERERKEVCRWVSTLVARPEVRMGYGLLMISETQGIGKSMLGARILAPLVGLSNTSFPGEADITSDFNGWIAHKRLAVIHEVYSGHSKKTYTQLKSAITDPDITVNKKYISQYVIENWCHIYAASNSLKALKMDDEDRRWYYPTLTEKRWSPQKFYDFHKWLRMVGLGAIKAWCHDYGEYVQATRHAPMTMRKSQAIEEGQSQCIQEACRLASCLENFREGAALVSSRDINKWLLEGTPIRFLEPFYIIKRSMLRECPEIREWSGKVKMDGQRQTLLLNKAAWEMVVETRPAVAGGDIQRAQNQKLRELRRMPMEILPQDM